MPLTFDKAKFFDWLWRIPLGVIFLCAAFGKIIDPVTFAESIYSYRLFPWWSLGPLAIFLPWVELWTGVLVLAGFWKKSAALIMSVLLLSFILAIGYNLARGLEFECGCFGSICFGTGGSGREAGFNLLWQDALLLICAVMLTLGYPRSRLNRKKN